MFCRCAEKHRAHDDCGEKLMDSKRDVACDGCEFTDECLELDMDELADRELELTESHTDMPEIPE